MEWSSVAAPERPQECSGVVHRGEREREEKMLEVMAVDKLRRGIRKC